jgi:alkylation response protein AidB-like acyl-CoA dehydrogenase
MEFSLTPEQVAFSADLRRWVDAEIPKDYMRAVEAREDQYPYELFDKLGAAGFHGMSVPVEYGGKGGNLVMQLLLARGLSRSMAGMIWIWGSTSFAGANSVGLYGTPKQKAEFLPRIAAGKLRVTIGFTEPGGGTDVLGAMTTKARKVDGGWVINGAKEWCTSAHASHYVLLLVRTDENVEKKSRGVTLFLMPTDAKGIKLVQKQALGMRGLGTFDMTLKDVFVPDDLVLGTPGEAWKMLLPTLANERTMLMGTCLGIMDGVLEDALAYMQERTAFGKRIGEFQALQHYVADIAMSRYQTELVAHHCAWLGDTGQDVFMPVTMGKVIASEHAVRAADLGIQILGGQGYSAQRDMQRYWRDARLMRFSPISNEMARNLIAENHGLPRSF